jgi:hypothetical protein
MKFSDSSTQIDSADVRQIEVEDDHIDRLKRGVYQAHRIMTAASTQDEITVAHECAGHGVQIQLIVFHEQHGGLESPRYEGRHVALSLR